MKTTTRIIAAVKLARAAYCDYSRIVLQEPVKAKSPVVIWKSGLGWLVDGRLFRNMKASEVIDYYDGLQRDYHQSIIDHLQKPRPTLDDTLEAASDKDVANSAT